MRTIYPNDFDSIEVIIPTIPDSNYVITNEIDNRYIRIVNITIVTWSIIMFSYIFLQLITCINEHSCLYYHILVYTILLFGTMVSTGIFCFFNIFN